MDETAIVEENLKDLLNVMVTRAEKEVDAILPGYTHLQVRPHPCTRLKYSAPNPFDGHTTSSPTPKPS
jgi:argininosuccinate lyase